MEKFRMKRTGCLAIIAMIFLSGLIGLLTITPPTVSAYTPHDPINIDGDADFAVQAASEGWPGDGTEGNPYVIEGYEITIDDSYPWYYNPIDIMSTEVHFVIRDSRFIGDNTDHGIFLNNVENGKIENCVMENSSLGLYIWAGSSNTIKNNIFINNNLLLSEAVECTFIGNKFIQGGFEVKGFEVERWNTHTIDTTNTINDKPVYYWKNRNAGFIPSGAGQVILANCSYVTVENQEFTNGSCGVILGYSSHNNIRGNTVESNNEAGINLWISSDNTITDNYLSSNEAGVELQNCDDNYIKYNEIKSNSGGISLFHSNRNHIINNNCSENSCGISIRSSSHTSKDYRSKENYVEGNIVMNNPWKGIEIENSDRNTFKNNIASNNRAGFHLTSSNGNKMIGNIAMNNTYGFYFEDFSDKNSIIANDISNNYIGICLRPSINNIFHHNNIYNNANQLSQNDSINTWDDGKGEGNYWSDYTGNDTNGDGVGDTDLPHQEVDYYPLVEPVDIEDYRESVTDDEGSIFLEHWFLWFIALFVFVIVIILILSLRKKQKPPKQPPEQESQKPTEILI